MKMRIVDDVQSGTCVEESAIGQKEGRRLAGVGNNDLFFSVSTERGKQVVGADEIVQTELIVGVHENGIDSQPRLTCPADSRQPHRERFGLSRNMQVELEQVPGLKPL